MVYQFIILYLIKEGTWFHTHVDAAIDSIGMREVQMNNALFKFDLFCQLSQLKSSFNQINQASEFE